MGKDCGKTHIDNDIVYPKDNNIDNVNDNVRDNKEIIRKEVK